MQRLLFDHTEFVIAAIMVIWAVRLLTKASVPAITWASLICMGGIIWFTGFPFWPIGETASSNQIFIGSAVCFVIIGALSLALDQTSLGRAPAGKQVR